MRPDTTLQHPVRRSSPLRLRAHERRRLPAPLGAEIGIFAGAVTHHFAGELLAAEEIPGSRCDLDRGDLVLPAELAEMWLFVIRCGVDAAEAWFGEDRHFAGAALLDR